MFKKGDYIVVLKDMAVHNCWQNFILKQYVNNGSILPELIPNVRNNYNCGFSYSNFKEKDDAWRYATPEEIEEYERLGEPFDVTTFTPFKLPDNWHILVTDENAEDVLTWRFQDSYNHSDKITFKNHLVGITINYNGTLYEKGHNSKDDITDPDGYYDFGIEITYEQFKKYVLNQDINKEDYTYLIKLFKKLKIK